MLTVYLNQEIEYILMTELHGEMQRCISLQVTRVLFRHPNEGKNILGRLENNERYLFYLSTVKRI